jgi:hypothetical protein
MGIIFFQKFTLSLLKFDFGLILVVKKIILKFFLMSLIFLSFPCFSAPFMNGDISIGETLHKENCSSCHNGMVPGGNGSEIYMSEFRAIKTSSKLKSQVEFCANQNDIAWFEEEIDSVSRFLNDNFYKFSY